MMSNVPILVYAAVINYCRLGAYKQQRLISHCSGGEEVLDLVSSEDLFPGSWAAIFLMDPHMAEENILWAPL